MKRILCVLMVLLLLLCGSALAQEYAAPFAGVKLSIVPPEGYAVETTENPNLFIADVRAKLLGALEYHLVISKLDFEGMADASLEELTEDQLAQMAVLAAGEVETYTHGVYDLENGMKVLVVDEVGEMDECALGYALIDGYLIGVRADRCGAIGPLMPEDYDRLLAMMNGITFAAE